MTWPVQSRGSSVWHWCCCLVMGGTSSRGRAFAAMNDEQALTPTTPRRDVTQPWSLPPKSSDRSCSEDRREEHVSSTVFDGKYWIPFVAIS